MKSLDFFLITGGILKAPPIFSFIFGRTCFRIVCAFRQDWSGHIHFLVQSLKNDLSQME